MIMWGEILLQKAMNWLMAGYSVLKLGAIGASFVLGSSGLPALVISVSGIVAAFSIATVLRGFWANVSARRLQYAYMANVAAVLFNMTYIATAYHATVEPYEYLVIGTLLEVIVFAIVTIASFRESRDTYEAVEENRLSIR